MTIRPALQDLDYLLFDRALHPELFAPLASRSWTHRGYSITLHLCAAGHVLTANEERRVLFTEVIGDRQDSLPVRGRLTVYPVRGQKHRTQSLIGGIALHTAHQLESLEPEQFAHVHQELWTDAARSPLAFGLRSETDGEDDSVPFGAEVPLGYADPMPTGDSFGLHLYQTFPAESAVLKTQALIEFP